MGIIKRSPVFYCTVAVGLFFAVSLFLRVCLPYEQVFSSEGVKLTSADAYYHMRIVDNLVYNFPEHMTVDSYAVHPGATGGVTVGFFIWLIAIPAWMLGGSAEVIDKVGVFMPAILGALIVIPVYFIGKELFGRVAGVLSAGLIAILPGEFMGRSILGFTDYHIAESLLTAVTVLFLILAVKSAGSRKSLMHSMLAGVVMGVYIFTWSGSPLFVFIITVFFLFQFIIDHLKGKGTGYLFYIGVAFFGISLVIAVSVSAGIMTLIALMGALLSVGVAYGLSRIMVDRNIRGIYYPLALIGAGIAGALILYWVSPQQFHSIVRAFEIFTPSGVQLTTLEMQPMINFNYDNPFALVWSNYNTSLIMAMVALPILIYTVIRKGEARGTLMVVWSSVILLATLGQRRFGYYLAVNIALLSGYMSWLVLRWGLRDLVPVIQSIRKRVGERKRNLIAVVVVSFIIVAVYLPNIAYSAPGSSPPAIRTASSASYAPSDDWMQTLKWVRENTPEPFGSSEAYYKTYTIGEKEEANYGIMAWWDYGYWITRIAHRVPVVNPSQNVEAITKVATFLTTEDEGSVGNIMQEMGAEYLILDYAVATSKLWAISTWADREPGKYFDIYLAPQGSDYIIVGLYHVDYYDTILARLFNFDGRGAGATNTVVISYENMVGSDGIKYKVVTSAEKFDGYDEAQAFISEQDPGNYRIVSDNPFESPVPVKGADGFDLVYNSGGAVKVFKLVSVGVK